MRLLVGPGLYDPRGNEAFLVKALKKIADVKTFDQKVSSFENVLSGLPHGWNPDAIVIRDAEFYKIPSGIECADSPIFGLIGDYNLSLNQMLPVMECFDYFFCDTKGVRIFNKLGFDNCEFFCLYGYDPELHRGYNLKKDWDVIFIGNLNRSVQQEREKYLYRLVKMADKYRVHISTGIFGADYARLLNRAHLVFNCSIRGEANMRFFEAMACGAVVMNNHLDELDVLGFRPDEHYLEYEDPQEAVLKYFEEWTNEKKESIKVNVDQILSQHSYDNRARVLVEAIETADIDISRRRLSQLSRRERELRWEKYNADEVELKGATKMNRYHPVIVGWQKCLIENELDINNFDFDMWSWWIDLLSASGLYSYLTQFLAERENLLSSMDCYQGVAKKIQDKLNTLVYGFHV
jgi:hypothetical protein